MPLHNAGMIFARYAWEALFPCQLHHLGQTLPITAEFMPHNRRILLLGTARLGRQQRTYEIARVLSENMILRGRGFEEAFRHRDPLMIPQVREMFDGFRRAVEREEEGTRIEPVVWVDEALTTQQAIDRMRRIQPIVTDMEIPEEVLDEARIEEPTTSHITFEKIRAAAAILEGRTPEPPKRQPEKWEDLFNDD